MPYKKILAALDGSEISIMAMNAALSLTEKKESSELIGCHVYAARLHRGRFGDMEADLPKDFKGKELNRLRSTHETLITDGLQLISDSYLQPLAVKAQENGIKFRALTPEGRNFVQILKTASQVKADLLILGACGQGQEKDLGSTAERVLLHPMPADVLLMRNPWCLDGKPIVVGVDGSANSYAALKQAVEVARIGRSKVLAVSVYDPFFHIEVFKHIAASLPERAKERFDLSMQERLHNEIIDEGLERLYRNGLEKGINLAESQGVEVQAEVLAGKTAPQIQEYASGHDAGLLVLGRSGMHHEPESLIGSNALRLARQSSANVLIVQ